MKKHFVILNIEYIVRFAVGAVCRDECGGMFPGMNMNSCTFDNVYRIHEKSALPTSNAAYDLAQDIILVKYDDGHYS